jgi:hypothetical protein
VIDPNPATGQGGNPPSLYISDPVTNQRDWNSSNSVGTWDNVSNWNTGLPDGLSITNVRHVTGDNQRALLNQDATVWELNVSGSPSQTMTLEVQQGARLTTFSGVNIESNGVIQISNGTLDAQFVDIRGGTLTGSGSVFTGSGPIPGQVENHGGTVAPGSGPGMLNISGRFVNGSAGVLEIELGGLTPGTQFDQVIVDGGIALGGSIDVSLVDGFTPSLGQTFEILTATDGISGTFESQILPAGFQWSVAYGSVAGLGLAGDFNGDGSVDAADYIVWRKRGGTQPEYNDWKTNFGRNNGAGASLTTGAVPEPCGVVLSLIGCAAAAVWRARKANRRRGTSGSQN